MDAIILFDGVCNFCNVLVNFIIEHDRGGYFKFAPLQSAAGEELLGKFHIDRQSADSVILIEYNKAYLHSTAALRIARKLDGFWSWAYAFIAIPSPIRDFLYKTFAPYRYRFFGKKDSCMIPTPEIRARFL